MSGEQAEERTAREGRMFPIQKGLPIPWSLAEIAYRTYAANWSGQSLERLAQRGGFGWHEFLHLYFGDAGWKLTDAQVEERWNANALQKAESECSRLASRVEELEKLLRRCYQWIPLEASDLADDVKEALGIETARDIADYLNGLAGAHAEER